MLAIFAPLQVELKQLLALLEVDTTVYFHPGRIWHGRMGSHELILARSGMGPSAMATTARTCFGTFHPESALLIGFGGATLPSLHQGDLVLSSTVVDGSSGQSFDTPKASQTRGDAACSAAEITSRHDVMVSTEEPVSTPHEKAFLGTQHQAAIVEMEGSAFAAEADAAGIPWLIARAVFDPMDTTLPEGLEPFHDDGTISTCSLLGHLARHPRTLFRLSSLHLAETKARDTLTNFAKAWIAG